MCASHGSMASTNSSFWILDFGFWIVASIYHNSPHAVGGSPKSKIRVPSRERRLVLRLLGAHTQGHNGLRGVSLWICHHENYNISDDGWRFSGWGLAPLGTRQASSSIALMRSPFEQDIPLLFDYLSPIGHGP